MTQKEIKNQKVLKNGTSAGYVKQTNGTWKWQFIKYGGVKNKKPSTSKRFTQKLSKKHTPLQLPLPRKQKQPLQLPLQLPLPRKQKQPLLLPLPLPRKQKQPLRPPLLNFSNIRQPLFESV